MKVEGVKSDDGTAQEHLEKRPAFLNTGGYNEQDNTAGQRKTATTATQPSSPRDVKDMNNIGCFQAVFSFFLPFICWITRGCDIFSTMRSSEDITLSDTSLTKHGDMASTSRTSAKSSSSPKYPSFDSEEERLKSFDRLPTHPLRRVGPKELAFVGYYYTGRNDVVICFHCGHAHGDWTGEEHPVIEHSRWHPECEHMRQVQGDAPVENIYNAHVDLLKKLEERAAREATEKGRGMAAKHFYGRDLQFYMNAGITRPMLDLAASHVSPNSSREEVLQKLAELTRLDPQGSWGLRSFKSTTDTYLHEVKQDQKLSMTQHADESSVESVPVVSSHKDDSVADLKCDDEMFSSSPSSSRCFPTGCPVAPALDRPLPSDYYKEHQRGSAVHRPVQASDELKYEVDLRTKQVVEQKACILPCIPDIQTAPGSGEPGSFQSAEEYPWCQIRHPRYRTLMERQRSFVGFPLQETKQLHGRSFAIAGFFYEGNRDIVTCFCCGRTQAEWCASDDPFVEHCIISGECPFLRKLASHCALHYIHVGHPQYLKQLAEKGLAEVTCVQRNLVHQLDDELKIVDYERRGIGTGVLYLAAASLRSNVTKDALEREIRRLTRVKLDSTSVSPCATPERIQSCIRQIVDLRKKQVVHEDIFFPGDGIRQDAVVQQAPGEAHAAAGRPLPSPKYPGLAELRTRMGTFNGFPFPRPCQIDPCSMALAGLFYTGRADETICFHCGNRLQSWEPTDKPLEKHAVWYPECEYINHHYRGNCQ